MKNSFSVLELILTILLISVLYTSFIPKKVDTTLDDLTNKLVLQLKHLRYKALIDTQYYNNEEKWHKKRWSIKFFRCNKDVGGIYYTIYSDKNKKGHVNIDESMKDPLSNKYIYTNKNCEKNLDYSSYVLLTKTSNITDINVTCNKTDSLGQLSFGFDGKVYSKLSNNYNDHEINDSCIIELINKNNDRSRILIEKNTGFIKKL